MRAIGLVLLARGRPVLPVLPGLVAVSVGLFVTGLALAPTLIALFSIIEASGPRSRLNEAMGVVPTGISAGIAPGAWLAGVVADDAGGAAAYWVGTVSAVLAALAMFAVPDRRRRSPRPGAATLIWPHGHVDELGRDQHCAPAQEVSPARRRRGRRRRGGRAAPAPAP